MGASVYANMLKMYSYYTNYVMSSDRNVEAETGFFIKKCYSCFHGKTNKTLTYISLIKESLLKGLT